MKKHDLERSRFEKAFRADAAISQKKLLLRAMLASLAMTAAFVLENWPE